MKPDCPNCQIRRCKRHKTTPLLTWWGKYGFKRWYWELYAIIKGEHNDGSKR